MDAGNTPWWHHGGVSSESGHWPHGPLAWPEVLRQWVDGPAMPPSWVGLDRSERLREARSILSRIEAGRPGAIQLRPPMPAVAEVQLRYGLTRSGAYCALRGANQGEGAPKDGRGFLPLSAELRDQLDASYSSRRMVRALAAWRIDRTGCHPESAKRWARRVVERETVRRLPPDPDANTPAGFTRAIERLERRYPGRVRSTPTFTPAHTDTGGSRGTPTDTD